MAPRCVEYEVVDTFIETLTVEGKVFKVVLEDPDIISPHSKEPMRRTCNINTTCPRATSSSTRCATRRSRRTK